MPENNEDILKTPKTPWYVKGIALAVVAAAAYGGWSWWKAQHAGQGLHYITQEAAIGSISVTVTADGTLKPTRTVTLGSEMSGIVRRVHVDVNSEVKTGDTLIDLDTRTLESKILSAQATLQSARAQKAQNEANYKESQLTYARMQDLHKRSGGLSPSKTELEQQKAKVDVNRAAVQVSQATIDNAEATLRSAETDLSKAHILSPIDGVVLTRNVEPGLAVAASLQAVELLTLASDLSKLELQVAVDEADVGVVAPGNSVYFTVSSYPNQHFPAELVKVAYGATTTENVVTYTAYMKVDNAQMRLRPGMTASATIQTAHKDGVLLVPNSAFRFEPTEETKKTSSPKIMMGPPTRTTENKNAKDVTQHGEGHKTLYVLRDGKPVRLEVTTGVTDGIKTEVVSGDVHEHDQVIVDQQRKGAS